MTTIADVLATALRDDVMEFAYSKGSAPGVTRKATFVKMQTPTLLLALKENQWRVYHVPSMSDLVNISAAMREEAAAATRIACIWGEARLYKHTARAECTEHVRATSTS